MSIDAVLAYWFGEPPADIHDLNRLWFDRSDVTDGHIREHFGAEVEQAMAGKLDHWASTPRGGLALVVLLDQFTRNLYRGQPTPFEMGPRALKHALAIMDRGEDRALTPAQRSVLYLPLEHAEDRAMQARAVSAFASLLDACAPAERPVFEEFLDYAQRHQKIIDRFGRYPHRNAALSRVSTAEEVQFLTEPGSSF